MENDETRKNIFRRLLLKSRSDPLKSGIVREIREKSEYEEPCNNNNED